MLVPDSIEPVIGWKGLSFRSGKLISPSHSFIWEPGVPGEAFCASAGKTIRVWEATPALADKYAPRSTYPVAEMQYGLSTDNWVYMVTTQSAPYSVTHSAVTYDMAEPPKVQFPYEVEWVMQKELNHGVAPAERCSCGLYMAAEPTFSYGPIIVELAGWGTVIPGTQGYKAQYAYPQRIFLSDSDRDKMKDLQVYGVEILPYEKIPGMEAEASLSTSAEPLWTPAGKPKKSPWMRRRR